MNAGNPTKDDVKAFWESEPLFTGEVPHDPYSREFLLAHEQVYRSDVFAGRGFPDEFFPFTPGARVLDVGCGPGIWTRELARRGYRTSAIDLTSAAVALAKNSLELLGMEADIQEGDAENLPFADGSFDGVVSHGVIHHTPDTARCVREMARILRPGGKAVVSVYYRNRVLRSKLLTRLAALVFSGWVALPGRDRHDLLASGDANEIIRHYDGARNPLGKAFTEAELREMFEQSGLRIVALRRYYFPRRAFGALGSLMAPMHAALAKRFGLMIALIAEKPCT
jgi:2-polyprenyl-3-methyl-5-hydroxy-6-metoxy-1,4-benzoquinol methylase